MTAVAPLGALGSAAEASANPAHSNPATLAAQDAATPQSPGSATPQSPGTPTAQSPSSPSNSSGAAASLAALRDLLKAPATERAAAIERLAAQLSPTLAPTLSLALEEADAEQRLRLEQALGSSSLAPELLLLLLADARAPVRQSAERAFAARLERFAPDLDLALAREERMQDLLLQRLADEPMRWFEITLAEDPRENFRRLGRFDRGPLPLVLDPALAVSIRRFASAPIVLRGGLDQLLLEIARQSGLELVLVLSAGERPEDAQRPLFLCLALEGQPVGTSGAGLLLGWLRGLATGDPEATRAEATALCLCGFSETLTLCGDLAFNAGHPGALWGVLAAAAEGRMDPRLVDPKHFKVLVGRALAELSGSSAAPFAAELAAAVERFPRIGTNGEDLLGLLLALPSNNERQARFLLRLMGGLGGGHPDFERRLLETWGAPPGAAGPALRKQALLSASQAGRPGFVLGPAGDPRALLPLLLEVDDARLLMRAAEACRATLGAPDQPWFGPGAAPELAALPTVLLARAEGFSLRALLAAGRRDQALPRLAAALGAARGADEIAALALAFQDWTEDGRRGELLGLLDELEAAQGEALEMALDRFALRLGLADGARLLRLQPALLADPDADLDDLAAAGALQEGALSRERLIARLRQVLESDSDLESQWAALFGSLSGAVEGLRRRGLDGEAQRLQQAVAAAVRRKPEHPLARSLSARSWPPPPGLVPLRLIGGADPQGAP